MCLLEVQHSAVLPLGAPFPVGMVVSGCRWGLAGCAFTVSLILTRGVHPVTHILRIVGAFEHVFLILCVPA